jgi:hypothetical protein
MSTYFQSLTGGTKLIKWNNMFWKNFTFLSDSIISVFRFGWSAGIGVGNFEMSITYVTTFLESWFHK